MDPLGYYLFSREEPIGAKTQDALASKKQDVPTFAFPTASSDALSTASAIAGILQGHYNADGTRRSTHGDMNMLQIHSSESGLHFQQQLNGSYVAGVSSRAVRADNVLSISTGSSGQVTRMPSKTNAATPPAEVDELRILRDLKKSSVSSSKITTRLHRGLIPNKEKQTGDVPTLPLSTNDQHNRMSEHIEAPGHAASFPWDISASIGDRQHHQPAKKVLPVKGPATVQKSKLLKLRLSDIAALSSASGVLLESDVSSGIGELFGQINGHSNVSVPKAKAPTKKKEALSAWTDEEDEIFLTAVKLHGYNWSKVAKLISSKSAKQVKNHAKRYGKANAKIVAPSPFLTASDHFAREDSHNVKKLFPTATTDGLQIMVNSKWATLKPKLKERYVKMAKKDFDRYSWEMQVFSALKEHQRNIGPVYGQSIKELRAEIRSAFPNIKKEGEERLLNERIRQIKQFSF